MNVLNMLAAVLHDIIASYTHFNQIKQSNFCCSIFNVLRPPTSCPSYNTALFVLRFVSAVTDFHTAATFMGKLEEKKFRQVLGCICF